MLGKLIKYEFKATSKFILMIFGLLLALSTMMSVSLAFNLDEIIAGISQEFQVGGLILGVVAFLIIMLFVVLNVAAICGMFFYAISRFKRNLLGDEGYLMHTLPVKTRDNILSKSIVSVIWTIVSFFVVGLAYFILLIGISETDIFKDLAYAISHINWGDAEVIDVVMEKIIVLIEFGFSILTSIIAMYFQIYASMSIGFSSNTHRVAKSIGIYVIIEFIKGMANAVVTGPLFLFGIGGVSIITNPHVAICGGILINLIYATVLYFVTHHFLSKKLNLL